MKKGHSSERCYKLKTTTQDLNQNPNIRMNQTTNNLNEAGNEGKRSFDQDLTTNNLNEARNAAIKRSFDQDLNQRKDTTIVQQMVRRL